MDAVTYRACVLLVGQADCHTLYKKDLKLVEEESLRRIVSFMSLHLRKELRDKLKRSSFKSRNLTIPLKKNKKKQSLGHRGKDK